MVVFTNLVYKRVAVKVHSDEFEADPFECINLYSNTPKGNKPTVYPIDFYIDGNYVGQIPPHHKVYITFDKSGLIDSWETLE